MSTELTNQPRFDLINSDSMLNLSKDLAKLIKEKNYQVIFKAKSSLT